MNQYDDGYDDEPREDDCDHEDYEADILTGEATCHRCGHIWTQTPEEIEAEIDRQRAYSEYEDRENRRQWWRDLWERIRSFFPRRKRTSTISDDGIPF